MLAATGEGSERGAGREKEREKGRERTNLAERGRNGVGGGRHRGERRRWRPESCSRWSRCADAQRGAIWEGERLSR